MPGASAVATIACGLAATALVTIRNRKTAALRSRSKNYAANSFSG
jgi:hypothetical protein